MPVTGQTSFFNAPFFGGGFFAADTPPVPPDVEIVGGGKGDNEHAARHTYKPTGLIDRPRNTLRLPKREETPQHPITPKLDDFPPQVVDMTMRQLDGMTDDGLRVITAYQMTSAEMIAEMRALLAKQMRTDEEEALLVIFMEAI